MSLIPYSAQLRSILKLTEKKDKLVAELAKIEGSIASLFGGAPMAVPSLAKGKRGRKPKTVAPAKPVAAVTSRGGKKSGRKGKTKDLIIPVLQSAGSKGISVAEISEKTGIKPANVHVWFSTTGRGIKEIKKVGPRVYRIAGVIK